MTDTPAALRRILGTPARELSCEECFELLDVYVDVESSGADAASAMPGMRPHLLGCPACAEEHDALLAFVGETGHPEG